MESSNILSFTRLGYLLKRKYTLNIRGLMIAFAAIAGAITTIGFLTAIDDSSVDQEAFISLYYTALFIGGYILTSRVFSEMQSHETAIHYMTLPASNLEKLISGWIYSSVIFLMISLVFFYVSYYLASFLTLTILGGHIVPISLVKTGFFSMAAIYLVLQPIFMLGAAHFKKHSFLKTLLALFILVIVFTLFTVLTGRILMGSEFDGNINIDGGDIYMDNFFNNYFVPVIKVLFWYVLAPFLLVVTYFTLKEREI